MGVISGVCEPSKGVQRGGVSKVWVCRCGRGSSEKVDENMVALVLNVKHLLSIVPLSAYLSSACLLYRNTTAAAAAVPSGLT